MIAGNVGMWIRVSVLADGSVCVPNRAIRLFGSFVGNNLSNPQTVEALKQSDSRGYETVHAKTLQYVQNQQQANNNNGNAAAAQPGPPV
jgi:hypothetical protein